MNVINYRVSLDMLDVISQATIKAKKGDSACKIYITLAKNGKLYKISEGCSATFTAKKSDGNFVYDKCTIEGDTIVYDFSTSVDDSGVCQITACEGIVDCEVTLFKGFDKLTSPRFSLVVDNVVYNGEKIISTPESDVLKELINEANSVIDEVENKLANGEFVGEKGEQGEKGEKGERGEKGEKGNDGYTPIKEVDYFTDSEQAEFIAKTAPPIVCEASGEAIVLGDASNRTLQGLNVYGKTTQEGTPSPENPQSLNTPMDVGVKVTGKNLIPFPYMTANKTDKGITFTVQDDGGIKVIGTSTADVFFDLCKHHFSDSMLYASNTSRNTDGKVVISGAKGAVEIIYEVGVDLVYLYIRTGSTVDTVVYPQIEYGTTPTEYEPYTGQSLALPILNEVGLAGVPVASGGNYTDSNGQQWVCDEVDFARCVYIQRVTEKVLNGTEAWVIFEGVRDDGTDWYYSLPKLTDAIDEGDGQKIICDQYPTNSISNNTERQGIGMVWRNIRIRWGTPLTIDEWKAHLAESPLTVQYVLAEPVEIPLDEATLSAFSALHTNKPNTTITNNAGVWMSAEYVADTKLYIDNKFAELAKAIVSNS